MFLPGKFRGQRSLVGYSPWSLKEWDTTKQLTLSLFPSTNKPKLVSSICMYIMFTIIKFLLNVFLVIDTHSESMANFQGKEKEKGKWDKTKDV